MTFVLFSFLLLLKETISHFYGLNKLFAKLAFFSKTVEIFYTNGALLHYILFQKYFLPIYLLFETIVISHMWGNQAEWVLCWEYWFWDTSIYSVKFLLYPIVFSYTKLSISLEP